MDKWPCLQCGKFHTKLVSCSSVASACSGADARQADKAPTLPTSEVVYRVLLERSRRLNSEAAVSPRSSDGLEEVQYKLLNLDSQLVEMRKAIREVSVQVYALQRQAKDTGESRDG